MPKDYAYELTRKNYGDGLRWHEEKTNSYDFSKYVDEFVAMLGGKSVLDAGCGTARDARLFLERGLRVTGVDFSEKTIELCKKKFSEARDAKFVLADVRKTGLHRASFDGVWACALLLNLRKKHVADCLKEFSRVLKPKGKLFVAVKKGSGERVIADRAGARLFSFFSESELRKLLSKADFEILSIETVSDASVHAREWKGKPKWICVFARATISQPTRRYK